MNPDVYLVLGVVLGIIFMELTDVSPGGLIVPGYIALYWDRPDRLAFSAGIAILAVLAIRLASRWFILFGRRRFALFLLAGFAIRVAAESCLPAMHPVFGGLEAVGWLIPGIIASDLARQGIPKTFLAMGAVSAMVRLIALAVQHAA